MHYLSGLAGIVFFILAGLFWQTPTIASTFVISGLLALFAIRPFKVAWWLFICGVASAVAAAFYFYQFFFELVALSESDELDPFDFSLLKFFAYGVAMSYVVSEYSCWLKGRQHLVNVKLQFKRRERVGVAEASRSP